MKIKISKKDTQKRIEEFFLRNDFTVEELKKIKRLAMKFNIKLGRHRKKFCKRCLSRLRGRIRISKMYRTIECEKCGYANRFKIGQKS